MVWGVRTVCREGFAELRQLGGLDVEFISPPLDILLGIRDWFQGVGEEAATPCSCCPLWISSCPRLSVV